MDVTEITHLSYSSVSTYATCARQWRYAYVDRLPRPTTPALAFGSAWHATIETVLRNNAERRGTDIESTWQEQWSLAAARVAAWDVEIPEELEKDGLRMLTAPEVVSTLSRICPFVDPEVGPLIEVKVELRVPGVPIPIVGYIDCIGEDGVPLDFKTAGRMWSDEQAAKEIQPLFYVAAMNQLGFTCNPDLRFRHIVFAKGKTTTVRTFEHRYTPSEIFWLFGMLQDVWRGINTSVFPPNPGAWCCSEKYCPFWANCRGKQ